MMREYVAVRGWAASRGFPPVDARKPNPSAGERLRALRESLGLSTRDVEEQSRQIAEERPNQEYHISHSWVTDIENGKFPPTIYKFHTFSVIYNRKLKELISYLGYRSASWAATGHQSEFPRHICWRAAPIFIRPGSLVQIDVTQTKLRAEKWRTEYDRPIYFVELRDGYVCSWCQVDRGQLIVIPHPRSHQDVRRFDFPSQAEIVGRVTGVAMQIAREKEPEGAVRGGQE